MATKNIENKRISREMTTGVITRSRAKRMASELAKAETPNKLESKLVKRAKSVAPSLKKHKPKSISDPPKLILRLDKESKAPLVDNSAEKSDPLPKGILKKVYETEKIEQDVPTPASKKIDLQVGRGLEFGSTALLIIIAIIWMIIQGRALKSYQSKFTGNESVANATSEGQNDFAQLLKNLKTPTDEMNYDKVWFEFMIAFLVFVFVVARVLYLHVIPRKSNASELLIKK